ncbi:MAG: putative CtpA-like serine protease [Syntrophus sp. PtaU1.Bin208]|nr:MAG: putative CtpA-like serine protease [Syntrophus sp. PtaU1.Bin208]
MNSCFSRRILGAVCLFAMLMLIDLAAGSRVYALDRSAYKQLKVFSEVLDIVDRNYVESVDSKKLIQGAINGMMKSLDPHSTFMTEEMYKELEVETKGSFGGIGIEITILKDVLTVVSPIEDTPAFLAGVKAGDQIIKIDGQSTKDITIMEAVTKLRGPKDTKVTITIMRENLSKPKDIPIARAIIQIKSIKARKIDDQFGYVRISSFQERTSEDLKKALSELTGKSPAPLKGLILDMRNNPGGLLAQSVEVSDIFLKSGTIVSTKGRIKSVESKSVAKDDGNEPTCPIVILVNEGTASAAEIVSGALQDNGRALVLGTQTFGKGSVQTVIPLEDGAALKLTTAKYYTPRGRSIQAEGITPDITVKYIKPAGENGTEAESVRERDLKGHIKAIGEEEKKPAEQVKRVFDDASQDNQLKAALDILKSWGVFQGSGKI